MYWVRTSRHNPRYTKSVHNQNWVLSPFTPHPFRLLMEKLYLSNSGSLSQFCVKLYSPFWQNLQNQSFLSLPLFLSFSWNWSIICWARDSPLILALREDCPCCMSSLDWVYFPGASWSNLGHNPHVLAFSAKEGTGASHMRSLHSVTQCSCGILPCVWSWS